MSTLRDRLRPANLRRQWRQFREIKDVPEDILKHKLEEVKKLLEDLDPPSYHWVLNEAAHARPWRPKRTGMTNVVDQCLHFLCGALLVLPCVALSAWWWRSLIGLTAGSLREIDQYFNQDLRVKMVLDRLMDTAFFGAGSLLLAFLFS